MKQNPDEPNPDPAETQTKAGISAWSVQGPTSSLATITKLLRKQAADMAYCRRPGMANPNGINNVSTPHATFTCVSPHQHHWKPLTGIKKGNTTKNTNSRHI
jgi:hypothetical protein